MQRGFAVLLRSIASSGGISMRNSMNVDHSGHLSIHIDHPTLEIICSIVHRSLKNRYRGISADAVRDAVQEAVCKLCEQRVFRSEINRRTVYSWLHTTASREITHMMRKDGWNSAIGALGGPRGTGMGFTYEALEEGIAQAVDRNDHVGDFLTYNALLGRLSNNLAEAVELHCAGYTAEEIAVRLGCSRAAAYKRVQRGCWELRELWRKEEGRVANMLS